MSFVFNGFRSFRGKGPHRRAVKGFGQDSGRDRLKAAWSHLWSGLQKTSRDLDKGKIS